MTLAMPKTKFRLDITVRLVPEDKRFPVVEKTGTEHESMTGSGWRSYTRLSAMTKAGKLAERAVDEAFGQEEL